MAETIRYDTSEDPVAAQSIAEKEAESLKIGEELMAKQEKMLAGKYKSAEELESAYLELQKKLGQSESTTETAEPEQEYDLYTEDGSVNYETANVVYGEKLGNTFKENGIDPFEMNEYFEKNNGTLSDEMYDKLSTAGLNKDMVDAYLKGLRGELGYPEAEQPVLTESEIKDIKNIAGGDRGYDNLMQWAGENLDQEAIKDFDDVLATGNKSAVKFAVTALMGKYEDSQGRDSKIVTGKESSTETYRSMAEVVRDMNKPEYQNDEAYRDDVLRKLSASNLKV